MKWRSVLGRAVLSTALCVLPVLSVSSPAEATVVLALSREQLVSRSDLVVRATVLSQRSQWNEDHTQILTLTRLRVTQYLKGSGTTELTLRQFGGSVDGLTSMIPGDAHLLAGQDVVLFLRRGNGVVYLTALAQSAYLTLHTPQREPVVQRDLHELTFAQLAPVTTGGAGTTGGVTQINNPSNAMTLVPAPAESTETLTHLLQDILSIVRRLG